MALRLYPERKVQGTDFSKCPKLVIPNQSMTLKDIIKRYIRGEPLKVSHQEGVYAEGVGDLEKMQYLDMVEQMEIASTLRERGNYLKKKQQDAEAEAKAKADAEAEEEKKFRQEWKEREEHRRNVQPGAAVAPE